MCVRSVWGLTRILSCARSAMDMDDDEDDETLLVGCAGALYKRADFLDKEEVSAFGVQDTELLEKGGLRAVVGRG